MKPSSPLERFHLGYVVSEVGCWQWMKSQKGGGYGAFSVDGRSWRAHRWAYETLVGPIAEGLTLDHLCRNRLCVNPAHLEPVTSGENTRRGRAARSRSTHCLRGHPFDEVNTRIESNGRYMKRSCRICRAARERERYHLDPLAASTARNRRRQQALALSVTQE